MVRHEFDDDGQGRRPDDAAWAADMRTVGTWGDTAAIHLTALALQVQVELVLPGVPGSQLYPVLQPRGWPRVLLGNPPGHYTALEECPRKYSFSLGQL